MAHKNFLILVAVLAALFITTTALAADDVYRVQITSYDRYLDGTNKITATVTLKSTFGNSTILEAEDICAISKKRERVCIENSNQTWRMEVGEQVVVRYHFGYTEVPIQYMKVIDE